MKYIDLPEPNIRVADLNNDGHTEILLENSILSVVLSPMNGGRITKLRLEEVNSDFTYMAVRPKDILIFLDEEILIGGLLQDHFMQPADSLWTGEEQSGEYKIKRELKDREKVGVGLSIIRRKESSVKGITINKYIILFRGRSQIQIHYEIINTTGNDLEIAYWGHNEPYPNRENIESKGRGRMYGNIWHVPTERGVIRHIFYHEGGDYIYRVVNQPFLKGKARGGDGKTIDLTDFEKRSILGNLSKGWTVESSPMNGDVFTVKFDFDKLLELYSWRGSPFAKYGHTISWIFKPVKLRRGQKWITDLWISVARGIENITDVGQYSIIEKPLLIDQHIYNKNQYISVSGSFLFPLFGEFRIYLNGSTKKKMVYNIETTPYKPIDLCWQFDLKDLKAGSYRLKAEIYDHQGSLLEMVGEQAFTLK